MLIRIRHSSPILICCTAVNPDLQGSIPCRFLLSLPASSWKEGATNALAGAAGANGVLFADYFSALRYNPLVSAEQIEPQRPVMAWIGGGPVYADEVRQLADVATEYQPHSWKPANHAAQKLFCCVECLRDMEVLLQTAGRLKNKTKQRRKLKIIHTPLYSLVEAIRDLANDLENNPDTICQLPKGARQLVPQLRSQLLLISTVEKGGLLATTRDKISAHVDRELSAEEMHILLGQANPSQIGLWLHTCVAVLSDFIKLPVYFWSCEPDGDGTVRILFKEPFVVTLGLDSAGKANRLLDLHMVPKPPRRDIFELLMRVVKNSKWMFRANDNRILNFVEDKPGDSWAKSLQSLPRFSGSRTKQVGPSKIPKLSADDEWYMLIPINVAFFVKQTVQRVNKPKDLAP